MTVVDQSSRELSRVCGDTCPHLKRVGVMALTIDFFFFQQREGSSLDDVRLVDSNIDVSDMLLLRSGNKA